MSLSGLRTLRRCISHRSLKIRPPQLFSALNNVPKRGSVLTKDSASLSRSLSTLNMNSACPKRSLSSQPYGQSDLDVFLILPPAKLRFLDGLADRGDIDNMIFTLKEIAFEEDSKFSPLFAMSSANYS